MIAAFVAAFHHYRKKKKAPPTRSETEKKKLVLDLGALARGTVPLHGIVVTGSGLRGATKYLGNFLPWLKRLLSACAMASAIAMGLFVYTEFVQAWKDRGLPTIPIAALSALEQAGQKGQPISTTDQTEGRNYPQTNTAQQRFKILDDYVG